MTMNAIDKLVAMFLLLTIIVMLASTVALLWSGRNRQGPTTPRLPSNMMDRCASAEPGAWLHRQDAVGEERRGHDQGTARRPQAGAKAPDRASTVAKRALGGVRDEAGWRRPMRPKPE